MKWLVAAPAALLPAAALATDPYRPTRQQLDEPLRGNTLEGTRAGRP